MAVISELIRGEENGSLSFGDYSLPVKQKKDGFEHGGARYKVKTCQEITRLERDGLFVYESTPGTAVLEFTETEAGASFKVEGKEDCEVTVGLSEETEYQVEVGGQSVGQMKSNLGGKLTVSVELNPGEPVEVKITKA